jgi:hypothetical protein
MALEVGHSSAEVREKNEIIRSVKRVWALLLLLAVVDVDNGSD